MTSDVESPPSRSRKKRDSSALQALGQQLADLPQALLAALRLPAPLETAIGQWRGMKSFEARRRQMQYIGRLMRETVDGDAIRHALDQLPHPDRQEAAALRDVETARAQLLAASAAELPAVCAALGALFPGVDTLQIARLVPLARAEQTTGKAGRHFRELFRHLKSLRQTP